MIFNEDKKKLHKVNVGDKIHWVAEICTIKKTFIFENLLWRFYVILWN